MKKIYSLKYNKWTPWQFFFHSWHSTLFYFYRLFITSPSRSMTPYMYIYQPSPRLFIRADDCACSDFIFSFLQMITFEMHFTRMITLREILISKNKENKLIVFIIWSSDLEKYKLAFFFFFRNLITYLCIGYNLEGLKAVRMHLFGIVKFDSEHFICALSQTHRQEFFFSLIVDSNTLI